MRLTNLETEATTVPSRWAEQPVKKTGFHPRPKIVIPIIVVIVLVIAYWLYTTLWIVTTGHVAYTEISVRPLIAGTIVQVPVKEGDRVKKGQLLVQFANDVQRTELAAQNARLDAARAHLAILQRLGVDPAIYAKLENARGAAESAGAVQQRATAALRQAQLTYDHAKLAASRADQVYLLKGVTKEEWEKTTGEFRQAEQALAMSTADMAKARSDATASNRVLAEVQRQVRYEQAKVAEQTALARQQVAEIEAARGLAAARANNMSVYAPRDGIVGWVHEQVGENVDNNDVVAMIYDPTEVWVQAYVQLSDLSYLKDGKAARLSLRGEPGGSYDGRIALFFPDEVTTERESPLSRQPIRAASNIGAVLHPVKVRFAGTPPKDLTPGTIAQVRISRY